MMPARLRKGLCGVLIAAGWMLYAQIELPEGEGPPEVPPPASREEGEKEAENPMSEQELRRLMQGMQGGGGINWGGRDPEANSPEINLLKANQAAYTSAPLRLKVRCELRSGRWVWGEMLNLGFFVKNNAGTFPVLLHQLERVTRDAEQPGIQHFHFSGGDLLIGKPGPVLLTLGLPDGGTRVLRLGDLRQVEILPQEP